MRNTYTPIVDRQELEGEYRSSESVNMINIEQVASVVRRQWRTVGVFMLLGLLMGIGYLASAVRTYTATESVMIDNNNQKIVDQMSAVSGVLEDEAVVLSQVELLKSQKIAEHVVRKLDLVHNAKFRAQNAGVARNLLAAFKSYLNAAGWITEIESAKNDDKAIHDAADSLIRALDVMRVGRTYVLTLSYSSADPEIAAKIARAYADAYLTDQLESKYEATKRASGWLQDRIAELRQKSLETDLAVQKFRANKGLIATDGQLVSEQQLTQINSQLIIAQTEAANTQAKYLRIKAIIDSRSTEAAVTESLESTVINNLRTKYLEASRKEADISSRLGPRHVQATRLRTEMGEYQRLMFDELGRIAQSYRSNFEVAADRQKSLEEQLLRATDVSATANDSQVQLRELERESDAYKKLYETFLERYQEAVQQQSFPVTEARIISSYSVPETPSSPKVALVLALSSLVGLSFGALAGAAREFRDRFFRTGDQVREVLDLEPLGSVPLSSLSDPSAENKSLALGDPNQIDKKESLADFVVNHPLSSFAETLRSAKLAVDLVTDSEKAKIVGVVSVLPGEGKTTISINFAELLANQGSRVVLIDADLRNPGATRKMGRHAERGLLEVLQSELNARDVLLVNPKTGLKFLPAVITRRVPYSSDLLSSRFMAELLNELSDEFDYIVIDLPPLAPVVDARAISDLIDAYIFVVEWGATSRSVVKKTLFHNSKVAEKCIGVILNKVETKKMRLYQTYGSSDYYSPRYSSYYGE